MTGDALIAKEPAQARVTFPPEAPKPTNKPANIKPTNIKPETAVSSGDASVTLDAAADAPEAVILATAHPKPAKRKNARERALEGTKAATKDGTTPMTAKAKSKVAEKKADKADKAAAKAQKADTKAAKIKAAKAAKAARAA